jgi:outer membrane lipoprotein SlyB
MAVIRCKGCTQEFNSEHHLVDAGALAAGALVGAWMGSEIGLAGGPWGAMAGTVPGAVVGGLLAYLGIRQLVKCPHCDKVFFV